MDSENETGIVKAWKKQADWCGSLGFGAVLVVREEAATFCLVWFL